jgi:hypothetical protein
VDLDGVLVDFDAGVTQIFGKPPEALSPRQMWPMLAKTPGFYSNLDWLAGGRELWGFVRELHPTILTGLPRGNWAEPQKREWCNRELGADVPVETCMSREKAERARTLAPVESVPVLVDDREKLREKWEAMGGIFIHHTDAASSISAVDSLTGGFASSAR